MTSLISSFSARSTWHAVGIMLLPMVADQLIRRVFSKKCSAYSLETASLVTGGVTYLSLSRELPNSFKIGAPILYLAYKAAQYYLSRQIPADSSAKIVRHFPYLPSNVDLFIIEPHLPPPPAATKPVEENGLASEPPASPPLVVVSMDAPAKSQDPLPAPRPAAPTAEEKAARQAVADRLNAAVEAERLVTLRFHEITKQFKKSERMSLPVQVNPLPGGASAGGKQVKAKTIKATLLFGTTHVFTMSKTQVEELNKAGCAVTENTLFFWIDIAGKQDGVGASVNFIPLMMLDNLLPQDKVFSMRILDNDCELILQFKENQLARLKTFAQTIKACRQVEVVRGGVLKLSPNTATNQPAAPKADNLDAFLANQVAAVNGAKCYLVPLMKKI